MNNIKKTPKKVLGRGLRALISAPAPIVEQVNVEEVAKIAGPKQYGITGVVTPSMASNIRNENITTKKDNQEDRDRVIHLDVNRIKNNPTQPRQIFNQIELEELSQSIKALGVIQPIVVRPIKNSDDYEIVAGERRWRASQLANLKQVPVIIKDLGDKNALEIALVENIQRSNLSPTEEARAYQSLVDDFQLTQKDLSERVGKDRATIANYMRLLKLPNEVLDLLDSGEISMGHAKAILSAREPSVQKNLANKCVREKLSVREIEEITARVVNIEGKKNAAKGKMIKSDFPEIADKLRKVLGTKVLIKHDKKLKKGKIVIDYFSEEDLDRITQVIM
jgi:ParB family chromosome partitioning protein